MLKRCNFNVSLLYPKPWVKLPASHIAAAQTALPASSRSLDFSRVLRDVRLCLNRAASDEIIWHCKSSTQCEYWNFGHQPILSDVYSIRAYVG